MQGLWVVSLRSAVTCTFRSKTLSENRWATVGNSTFPVSCSRCPCRCWCTLWRDTITDKTIRSVGTRIRRITFRCVTTLHLSIYLLYHHPVTTCLCRWAMSCCCTFHCSWWLWVELALPFGPSPGWNNVFWRKHGNCGWECWGVRLPSSLFSPSTTSFPAVCFYPLFWSHSLRRNTTMTANGYPILNLCHFQSQPGISCGEILKCLCFSDLCMFYNVRYPLTHPIIVLYVHYAGSWSEGTTLSFERHRGLPAAVWCHRLDC